MAGPRTEAPGRAAVLLVALAALLPYLNAFGHAFVRDDEVIIRDNAGLRSLPALWEALTSNYWGAAAADGQWRPLALLSWGLNYAAGGLATAGYTAVNLAIHAAVCLALWRLARVLGASARAAIAAALLFAVHPVHTEAVTGFVGRADTLATLCVLLALLAHRRAAGGGLRARALAALALLAALLTKESAIAALALIPAMDWLVPPPPAAPRAPLGAPRAAAPAARWAVRLRRDYPLYLLVAALYLAARWAVLGGWGRDPQTILPAFNPLVGERLTALGTPRGATPIEALLTPLALVAEAARLLVWPAHLSMDYSFEQLPLARSLFDARVLLGLAVVALAVAGVVWGRRRAPVVAFGAAFAALTWLPTSNLLFPIGTLFGERLLYLPSVGALLVAGVLWDRLLAATPAARPGRRAALVGLLVAVLLGGAARTWARNPDWRDLDAVTAAMQRDAPRSFLAQAARGTHLHLRAEAQGEGPAAAATRAAALDALRRSLAIAPEYEQANRAFIGAAWATGDPAAALPAYERLARIAPRDARVQQGWAAALIELAQRASGDAAATLLAEARQHLDAALALDPDDVDARYARGLLLRGTPGEERIALADLRAVLRLRPEHPERAAIEAEVARLQAAAPGG